MASIGSRPSRIVPSESRQEGGAGRERGVQSVEESRLRQRSQHLLEEEATLADSPGEASELFEAFAGAGEVAVSSPFELLRDEQFDEGAELVGFGQARHPLHLETFRRPEEEVDPLRPGRALKELAGQALALQQRAGPARLLRGERLGGTNPGVDRPHLLGRELDDQRCGSEPGTALRAIERRLLDAFAEVRDEGSGSILIAVSGPKSQCQRGDEEEDDERGRDAGEEPRGPPPADGHSSPPRRRIESGSPDGRTSPRCQRSSVRCAASERRTTSAQRRLQADEAGSPSLFRAEAISDRIRLRSASGTGGVERPSKRGSRPLTERRPGSSGAV